MGIRDPERESEILYNLKLGIQERLRVAHQGKTVHLLHVPSVLNLADFYSRFFAESELCLSNESLSDLCEAFGVGMPHKKFG